jgi:hypothetical protein
MLAEIGRAYAAGGKVARLLSESRRDCRWHTERGFIRRCGCRE